MLRADEIEKIVYTGLARILAGARGHIRVFKAKDIAIAAGIEPKTITLTIIKSYLDGLVEKGLLIPEDKQRIHTKRRGRRKKVTYRRYIITQENPLWAKLVGT